MNVLMCYPDLMFYILEKTTHLSANNIEYTISIRGFCVRNNLENLSTLSKFNVTKHVLNDSYSTDLKIIFKQR